MSVREFFLGRLEEWGDGGDLGVEGAYYSFVPRGDGSRWVGLVGGWPAMGGGI